MYSLTNKQARQFILLKHGLIGEHRFAGKQGVLDFVGQAGCIQFDPIDICGKNAELVLQSRIKGFSKQMLYELLYEDRKLLDYFDKNLAIMSVTDWKYFSRFREAYKNGGRSHEKVDAVCADIKALIKEKGPVSSSDIGFNEKVNWYWSDTKLSRAALETLYFRGELAVHHKKGAVKYYDLAENCVPDEILNMPDPYPDDFSHKKWRVLRRIGSVGLLWNKPSDAWLKIWGLASVDRKEIFRQLLAENEILEIKVENINDMLYCLESDAALLDYIMQSPKLNERCELLAPLDNMLWDRRLILALFGFDYKWEIYTPASQRKYGYYTLPLLHGNSLIGRVEAVNDRSSKRLLLRNIWFEDGAKRTKKLETALARCLERFVRFNGCNDVEPDESHTSITSACK